MTLVDTAEHGDQSERRLAAALRAGPVVVNDVIAAELAPIFDTAAALWSVLGDAEVELVPYPREAVFLAGEAFKRYRRRGGRRNRILPDFMIGAHAVASRASLLTRDGRFYRDLFPGLRLA